VPKTKNIRVLINITPKPMLSDHKSIAIKAAQVAGNILKRGFFKGSSVEGKGLHDVVTATDRESENSIISELKQHFPDHNIIAEESGSQMTGSEYTWYIDPLDGTSNFVTGNPYFSVSIALCKNDEVILGVVLNPILDELYVAEKNMGAFMNDQPLQVSKQAVMSEALLASAYAMTESEIKLGLRTVEVLALNVRKVVINFSPALDLCNIARGRLDGLVDNGTTPEDHAAASLILSEAGGVVQNYGTDTWDVSKVGIVASNGLLHQSLLGLVGKL